MTQDFLDQLGELALGSRLKRLSERMQADAADIYQHFGLDIQPKWFTLLALLEHRGQVSVVDAADSLGLSQPAISQFCRQLAVKGLVVTEPCRDDSRRRMMRLTPEGEARVAQMQPLWRTVRQVAEQICMEFENDFYRSLQKCERALKRKSLFQRAVEVHNE